MSQEIAVMFPFFLQGTVLDFNEFHTRELLSFPQGKEKRFRSNIHTSFFYETYAWGSNNVGKWAFIGINKANLDVYRKRWLGIRSQHFSIKLLYRQQRVDTGHLSFLNVTFVYVLFSFHVYRVIDNVTNNDTIWFAPVTEKNEQSLYFFSEHIIERLYNIFGVQKSYEEYREYMYKINNYTLQSMWHVILKSKFLSEI